MEELKKKQKIAFVLTLITLANIWASLACDIPNIFAKGAASMVTVILIGITIERWARYLQAYIKKEIDKNNQRQ